MMKKYGIVFFIFIFTLAVTQDKTVAPASEKESAPNTPEIIPVVELGIDSITQNKDGSYQIAVYMLNEQPVAGYQMDFLPAGVVTPLSIHGGVSEELGYMMKSSENGKVLGFSMQGTPIPIAASPKPDKNILYYLDVTIDGKAGRELMISFDSVVAGSKGIKLEAANIPYRFKLK